MIPMVNQILVWEKELEIRNQPGKHSRFAPDRFPVEAPDTRKVSNRSIFNWIRPESKCECPQATGN